jgi:hypothetical protein
MRRTAPLRWSKIGIPVAVAVAGFIAAQLVWASSTSAATTAMSPSVAAAATPASASASSAVPVTVSATSASDSTLKKSITVRCPAGRSAVGVSATTTRPWAVHIISLTPKGSSATASARVFAGTDNQWSITVTAICVTTPAGLTYVPATSTTPITTGGRVVAAKAYCPTGKQLVGFGGSVGGGRILSFMPQGDPATGIFLSGEPFIRTSGTLTVTTVAVCATARFVSKYEEAPLVESQGQPVVSAANCPAGMYVHAVAGWAVNTSNANDGAYVSDVTVINDSLTAASLILRSAVNRTFSGKVIPFCVGVRHT